MWQSVRNNTYQNANRDLHTAPTQGWSLLQVTSEDFVSRFQFFLIVYCELHKLSFWCWVKFNDKQKERTKLELIQCKMAPALKMNKRNCYREWLLLFTEGDIDIKCQKSPFNCKRLFALNTNTATCIIQHRLLTHHACHLVGNITFAEEDIIGYFNKTHM